MILESFYVINIPLMFDVLIDFVNYRLSVKLFIVCLIFWQFKNDDVTKSFALIINDIFHQN